MVSSSMIGQPSLQSAGSPFSRRAITSTSTCSVDPPSAGQDVTHAELDHWA
jgi:hypothetical protein